jgi:hypothetical protein
MKPSWMAEFHSESCKNIFDICTRFNMGMMSKAEAKDALNVCDLSNKASFKSYVIRDLDVIFAEEPKKRFKRPEPVVAIIEQPIEEVVGVEESTVHEVVLKEDE